MEHGKIKVDIQETYEGSQHFEVTIFLPGYGRDSGFKLVNIDSHVRDFQEESLDLLGDTTLRPEYAKAIKRLLENE